MNALISVVLPFRDASATIDSALASVLTDSDPAIELVAIDDGSTDSGPARVRTWAARDPRVRLVTSSGHGLVAALNTGVACARGELIARMDADDLAHPLRLSLQRAYLRAHPAVALLGTRVRPFADDGPVGEGLRRYVDWQNAILTPEQHRLARFIESPICHPSWMMRRSLLAAIGPYRAHDGPEDYELLLRCSERGHELAKLDQELLSWRQLKGRATFSDPRYSLPNFRRTKAPFLAHELARHSGRETPRRVVIWGAGPTGRRLARALAACDVRCAAFVDIDPRKLGRSAQGVTIGRIDSLDAARDSVVVAVGARGARALIGVELRARGFVEGQNAWFAS